MSRWDGFEPRRGTLAELREDSDALRETVRRQKEILEGRKTELDPYLKAGIDVVFCFVVIALIVPWLIVFMDSVLEAYTGYARWVKWVAK